MSRFDEVWPTLERRVRAVLAARGVRGEELNDLTQETALRLFRAWDTLDPERPVVPYATTIALNAWRDGLKRASTTREVFDATVPEQADTLDVERTVIARLELSRVSAALRELRQRDRDALMGDEPGAAHRMARMRARRELLAVLERASAAVGILFGLRHAVRPRGASLAASAGALTLVSMVAIGSTPSTPAHTEALRPMISKPVVAAPTVKVKPVAKVAPAQVAVKPQQAKKAVAHKAKPAAPACSERPSSPPEEEDNGLPVSYQLLTPETLVDVFFKPTGTRVHSSNDGCTQVTTGP